jgi:hypothetical protein
VGDADHPLRPPTQGLTAHGADQAGGLARARTAEQEHGLLRDGHPRLYLVGNDAGGEAAYGVLHLLHQRLPSAPGCSPDPDPG